MGKSNYRYRVETYRVAYDKDGSVACSHEDDAVYEMRAKSDHAARRDIMRDVLSKRMNVRCITPMVDDDCDED